MRTTNDKIRAALSAACCAGIFTIALACSRPPEQSPPTVDTTNIRNGATPAHETAHVELADVGPGGEA